MWTVRQNPKKLVKELILRVVLLLLLIAMQLSMQKHAQYITEAEVGNPSYKSPRRDSVVATWLLLMITVFMPLTFFLLPLILSRNQIDTTQALLSWTLSIAVNAVATEGLKLSVRRPRPDFFFRCFPDGEVTKDLLCTGDYRQIIEGRKSFPSGHSSFSFCTMVFLSLWLSGRLLLSRRRRYGLKIISWIVPVGLATAIALSRVYDNHHHWGDIVVGSLLGSFSSVFCYFQYYNPLTSDLSGLPFILTVSEKTGEGASSRLIFTRSSSKISLSSE